MIFGQFNHPLPIFMLWMSSVDFHHIATFHRTLSFGHLYKLANVCVTNDKFLMHLGIVRIEIYQSAGRLCQVSYRHPAVLAYESGHCVQLVLCDVDEFSPIVDDPGQLAFLL